MASKRFIDKTVDSDSLSHRKKVWNNTTGTGTPTTYLKYIYDGWNLIAELNAKNSNAVVRTYSWGPEAQGVPGTLRMIADNNGVYFPAYDPNGNMMGLVKASDGTVCAQYEYLPYGEQVTATGTMAVSNPIRFSTKYYDTEARLYYYGYRYYSPDMGRWLSRDPIEEQGGLNLYSFVNNDPVNHWDLWGMDISECNFKVYREDFDILGSELEKVHIPTPLYSFPLIERNEGIHYGHEWIDADGIQYGFGPSNKIFGALYSFRGKVWFGAANFPEKSKMVTQWDIECISQNTKITRGITNPKHCCCATCYDIRNCIATVELQDWEDRRRCYFPPMQNCRDFVADVLAKCGLKKGTKKRAFFHVEKEN